MKKIKYVVIDNDTKEPVSVETTDIVTIERWTYAFNRDCHASGGSCTQYGFCRVEELETE